MHYKVDLHTHSIISHDGGLREEDYRKILDRGMLDYVAITDHNETGFAKRMYDKLGDKIIIGEEIKTRDGEIIGLFLQQTIPPGRSPQETIKLIRDQHGLVYIPHPFEIFRKGLQAVVLHSIATDIDIMEVFNARGFWRGKVKQAEAFAKKYNIPLSAASDAHGPEGVASAFSIISEIPTQKTLKQLIDKGSLQKKYAPPLSYLRPALNKVKKQLTQAN